MPKMNHIYKFEWGEYSDYTEVWYFHEQKMTYKQLTALLKGKLIEAVTEKTKLEKQQWDECEKLFGMRTWPWNVKLISPKGTNEEFFTWRDKWSGKLDFLSIWLGLSGFTRIHPLLEIDMGGGIYDKEDAIRFITKMSQGSIKGD